MKVQVEMKYSAKEPMFVTELDVPTTNLIEAKLAAADMAKKLAYYAGHKNQPKTINVFQLK